MMQFIIHFQLPGVVLLLSSTEFKAIAWGWR